MLIDKKRLRVNAPGRIMRSKVRLQGGGEVLVLDDFYADPDYVRELALSLDFIETRGRYPGFQARISLELSRVCKAIGALIGRELSMLRGFDTYVFAVLSDAVDPARRWHPIPHWDGGGSRMLAGLVYLNPPQQCRGGTAFYRHRETGWTGFPGSIDARVRKVMKEKRIGSLEGLADYFNTFPKGSECRNVSRLHMIAGSTKEWELIEVVEMRYNRLILYEADAFHAIHVRPGDFGEGPRRRRLTQSFALLLPEPVARAQ